MTELLSRIFVKDHKNTQSPTVRSAYGTMVSIVGILFNILLFLAKFTVGTLFGSIAIRADAINNLSDAGSQVVSLISFRIAAKPADREHPFGHARIEYVSSMIVAFLILVIGFDVLKESIGKIIEPELPDRSTVAVAVLILSIAVKLWLGFFNRKIGKRINSGVMRASATDCFSDCLSTGAILISTLISLLFPELGINLDAYMGVIVAILILVAGGRILSETKNSILGEAPADETVETIRRVVEEYPQALGMHDLTVHNYGPGHTVAAFHVEVDGSEDIFLTHDMVDTIEQRLRHEHHINATIHMDPIVTDDEETNRMRREAEAAVHRIDPMLKIHDFRFVPGATHTNLIFDVAVPFEIKMKDDEIRRRVDEEIRLIDPTYCVVLTVDRV
ncbi:MAG: cation transporter [Clostridia bacterium]|nr:cation transporter [Clostridia bacterium]